MRDYTNFDLYYDELISDVYPQPIDDGHLKNMKEVIEWISVIDFYSVLDVGCGDGDAQDLFIAIGRSYWGITYGKSKNLMILDEDYNFIPTGDSFAISDLVFSRHSLEHSPFPLITLMEWHRVSKKWLCLVLPNPRHYTYTGRNHYSVMNAHQAAWILRRAGWKIRKFHMDDEEIWFLCEKFPRISYEGWAKAPISNSIYEFERDELSKNGDIDVVEYFKKRERKDEVF